MARKKQDAENVPDSTQPDSAMTTEATTVETAAEEKAAKPAKIKEVGEKKTGQALLDFVQANQGASGEDLALGAGYFTKITDPETGETQTRIHKNEFFKCLTEASAGIVIPATRRSYSGPRNRAPVIKIGKGGNCVVGSRHTAVAGFEPSSRVQVTAEAGRIILVPFEGSPDEAEVDSTDEDMEL